MAVFGCFFVFFKKKCWTKAQFVKTMTMTVLDFVCLSSLFLDVKVSDLDANELVQKGLVIELSGRDRRFNTY